MIALRQAIKATGTNIEVATAKSMDVVIDHHGRKFTKITKSISSRMFPMLKGMTQRTYFFRTGRWAASRAVYFFLFFWADSICFIFLILLIIFRTCSLSGVVSQYFLCSFFCAREVAILGSCRVPQNPKNPYV